MAANRAAAVFILGVVLFALSHTAEAYIDHCEEECYKRCEADKTRWVPCPAKCFLSTCKDSSGLMQTSMTGPCKLPDAASPLEGFRPTRKIPNAASALKGFRPSETGTRKIPCAASAPNGSI